MRLIGISLAVLLASTVRVQAQDSDLEELRRENKELASRVRQLEEASLEESIESYLDQTEPESSSEGPESILPGGIKLRVSGQVAFRFEVRDRVYAPNDPDAMRSFNYTLMRTRIRFDVDVHENLGVVVELQDVRNFGQEQSTVAYLGNVDLKRGIVDFRNIGGAPISVEIGRFVMYYGDQRVIGHLEWLPQGRSFDGLRARYRPDGWWLDFFATRIRQIAGFTPDDNQDLLGFYGGAKIFEGYLLYLDDGLPGTGETGVLDDTAFLIVGARVHDDPGNFDYTAEGLGQFGDVNGDSLEAWGAALEGGYTFANAGWKPRIGFIVAWASGDKNPTDGRVEQLQAMWGTDHLHYGYMDIVGFGNILNFELNVRAKPAADWFLEITYHHFRRPEAQGPWVNVAHGTIRPGQAGTSSHLGDEIDLLARWKPHKAVTFEAGYAIFFPGDFVKQTGASPTSQFFYLQIQVKF